MFAKTNKDKIIMGTQRKREMTKTERILSIYDDLLDGQILTKTVEAERYQVDDRTIQRDLQDIRLHLKRSRYAKNLKLVYDRKRNGYEFRKSS